jgi:hypothetical protein
MLLILLLCTQKILMHFKLQMKTGGSAVNTQATIEKCNAVQCNAVQCKAVQCNAVQCKAVQCSAIQFSTV